MDNIQVRGPEELFTWGSISITQTVLSMTIVTLVLLVAGILLGRNLKKRPGKIQVLTEMGVGMLIDLVAGTMGKHNVGWVPFIGTIFLSSLFGSLIGLTGFLRSTTADLAVVLTWSVMVSVIIWYKSIKHKGLWGWLKGFAEPIVVMTPMNVVSEIAQPLSMAFRHFGNIAGGSIITMIIYTVLALVSTLVLDAIASVKFLPVLILVVAAGVLIWAIIKKNWIGYAAAVAFAVLGIVGLLTQLDALAGVQIPLLQIGVPAVLSIYFDLFSGFVQAFVFSLLTMVYIAGSLPEPEA